MISVAQALAIVEQAARPLAASPVPLSAAHGLLLAEDVVSDVDSPPFDKSLVDGYAVASSDPSPSRLVVEQITAGSIPQRALGNGEAAQVMTGAPIPAGSDAVIMKEECTTRADNIVEVPFICWTGAARD